MTNVEATTQELSNGTNDHYVARGQRTPKNAQRTRLNKGKDIKPKRMSRANLGKIEAQQNQGFMDNALKLHARLCRSDIAASESYLKGVREKLKTIMETYGVKEPTAEGLETVMSKLHDKHAVWMTKQT